MPSPKPKEKRCPKEERGDRKARGDAEGGDKQEDPKAGHRGCCCESLVPTPMDMLQVTSPGRRAPWESLLLSLGGRAPQWQGTLEAIETGMSS